MKDALYSRLACLVFLLLVSFQWSAHSKLIWQGYPYEEWDEIGSSNNAAVLDEPETLRAYSYGSLDTFLHVIAHFYYQKFDDLGKRHLRHSFANNVPQSLNDPFYVYGPKADPNALDYNYFRGLNDREVIFKARKLYILVAYGLLTAFGLLILAHYGWRGCPAALCLLILTSGPMFSTQAAYALPNANNSLLAVGVVLTSLIAISRADARWLFISAGLTAAGVNMKVDFASLTLVLALAGALTWSRTRWSLSQLSQAAGMTIVSFIICFIVTRPMVLIRPLGEWGVQYNTLSNVVSSSVDKVGNFNKLPSFLSSELFAIGQSDAGVGSPLFSDPAKMFPLLGVVTLLCLLFRVLVRKVDSDALPLEVAAQGWREIVLFALAVSLLWWVPITRSVQLYPRYFLYGSSVWWLFVGLSFTQAFLSSSKLVRGFAGVCVLLLASLYVSRVSALVRRESAMIDRHSTLAGLDPAHTRNRISFEAVRLIDQGKFEREILVDQHSYTDLRFFWIHNIRTRYINMLNYEGEFAAVSDDKKRLVLFAPADGGGGEELIKYNRYRDYLLNLPSVSHIAGNTMSTLSPAPVVPTSDVMLLGFGG